tara:strand:- start:316 stop:462 length:147 start_codon:yes stop_codon:yes gene_type:complete
MNNLEMLTAREQLMEDIISIVEDFDTRESMDSLTALLCDAVCKNYPAN